MKLVIIVLLDCTWIISSICWFSDRHMKRLFTISVSEVEMATLLQWLSDPYTLCYCSEFTVCLGFHMKPSATSELHYDGPFGSIVNTLLFICPSECHTLQIYAYSCMHAWYLSRRLPCMVLQNLPALPVAVAHNSMLFQILWPTCS
jgi:hypothetical protein